MAGAVTVRHEIKGPLFARVRRGGEVLEQAHRDWITDLTREGEAKAQAQLYAGHGAVRGMSGGYKSTIHSKLRDSKHGIIGQGATREMAIIGNWLEGRPSRNARHRFRGYHIWRKTRTHVRRLANELAGRVYSRATKRLT